MAIAVTATWARELAVPLRLLRISRVETHSIGYMRSTRRPLIGVADSIRRLLCG